MKLKSYRRNASRRRPARSSFFLHHSAQCKCEVCLACPSPEFLLSPFLPPFSLSLPGTKKHLDNRRRFSWAYHHPPINNSSYFTPIGTPFAARTASTSTSNNSSISASNCPSPAAAIGTPLRQQGQQQPFVSMAGAGGVMDPLRDFHQRFQSVQAQRQMTEDLIKDLMEYVHRVGTSYEQENQRLKNELRTHQLDLTDAKTSRRHLQQQLREIEVRSNFLIHENDILKNRNPYVIILIDGDGLLFKEDLIRQGIEGGKTAAYALRSGVAGQCDRRANEVEIICKVCANLNGLAQAMRRDGSLDNPNDLRDFMLGFTQARASFDFVDVGYGKERADAKIQETTRFHLRNSNCKQILLGVSHDAGYAPFLDQVCLDEETKQRITILEGFPTVREIATMADLNILKFPEIFRSDKLVDRRTSIHQMISPAQQFSQPTAQQQQQQQQQQPQQHASPVQMTAVAASPQPSIQDAGGPPQRKASPPPTITLPIKIKPANNRQNTAGSKKIIPPPHAAWNPGRRGLDPPLQINQTVLDMVKRRRDNDKLCNNHYLRGPCAKGDDCCFEHNYKPSKDEINVIAFLARLNPCTNGQDCEVPDCIYGHHCPSTREGVCRHPHCKFREEEHPPGTKFLGKGAKKQQSHN